MSRISPAMRDRILAELSKESPLPRRTLALRAGCSEATVRLMCLQGLLTIVGRERPPNTIVKIPRKFWHPVVAEAS